MGKVYFIADLHFGHEAIIRYENRPFSSVEEMDRTMMERWNQAVFEEDTVFILGDFSAYSKERDIGILRTLRGRKILIMGNHDRHRTPEEWRQLGFAECSPWPVVYQEFFLLSHEPLYLNRNMPYANLYGHVHGNSSFRDVSRQSICLSAERLDYTPVSFEEIKRRMQEEQ